MLFRYGRTRWVFVFKKYVVKVARIRPLAALIWLCQYLAGAKIKPLRSQERSLIRITIGVALYGIRANLLEYNYSKNNPDDNRVFHVVFCFLGIVSIQHRGHEITCSEKWKKYCEENPLLTIERGDLKKITQLAQDRNGKIKIVDYGERADCENLEAT